MVEWSVPERVPVLMCCGELAVKAAVAVGDEPSAHCDRHAAENKEFVADD